MFKSNIRINSKTAVKPKKLKVKRITVIGLVKTTCFQDVFILFLYLCLHFPWVCLHCWSSSADSVLQSAQCSRISVGRTYKYKQ